MFHLIKSLFRKKTDPVTEALARGAVILDVRTPGEFRQGHIKGARNVPLNEVRLRADTIRSWGKPVITVCQSGMRSQSASSMLNAQNIETYNGGSWKTLQKKHAL